MFRENVNCNKNTFTTMSKKKNELPTPIEIKYNPSLIKVLELAPKFGKEFSIDEKISILEDELFKLTTQVHVPENEKEARNRLYNAYDAELKRLRGKRDIKNTASIPESKLKDLAITFTANSVDKTDLCVAALRKYAIHKDEFSASKIFNTKVDKDGFGASLQAFYKWIRWYEDNLDILKCALQ